MMAELFDALPSWLPSDVWNAYVEMRNKAPKAKRPTAYALQLVQNRLHEFHKAGQSVQGILEQSIRNSWADVYPVKQDKMAIAHGMSKAAAATMQNLTDFLGGNDEH